MAVDAFIYFTMPDGKNDFKPIGESNDKFFKTKSAFEIKEFSFDIEQVSTGGSATGGFGAGKVKFNEFTIKKPTDWASTLFFKNCVTGMHYKTAVISVRKAGATQDTAGEPYLEYCFETVFTTKIEWSGPGDEAPEESITFAYGKLGVCYRVQKEDGTFDAQAKITGWDQTKNKVWDVESKNFSAGK
jgi:type VI secretion system secreted protein Hcp